MAARILATANCSTLSSVAGDSQWSQFPIDFGNVLSPDQLGSIVLLFQTLDEIRDVFVQILPVFKKVHPIDSRRGTSFELPKTPLEKILVQQPIQIAKPVLFVFCCPTGYSPQSGLHG